jgi:transcriptional accessory protein Tex/SPT6
MNDQETPVVEQPAVTEAEQLAPAEVAVTAVETADVAATANGSDPAIHPPSIHNLQSGQRLTGKIKNIAEFGAFVDIGIAQDGLVHISELSKQKVDKVTDVVGQGQEVEVWVKKVDTKRGRISLTMIKPVTRKFKDIAEDTELEGIVTRLEPYGAFVDVGSDRDGLVHISQITHEYIKHPQDALTVGQEIRVKVLKVNKKKRQVDLSVKALLPPPPPPEEVKVVDEIKVVERERAVEEVSEGYEEEPKPTAMAVAMAALQGSLPDRSSRGGDTPKGKNKRKREIDDIISRTLAGRN